MTRNAIIMYQSFNVREYYTKLNFEKETEKSVSIYVMTVNL